MGYAYNGEHWCDSCGEAIKEELDAKGIEDTGDTNDYPQWFDGSQSESDAPCHCGSNEECLEAESLGCTCDMNGTIKEIRLGAIVCERLTSDGIAYVKERHMNKPTSITFFWKNFFEIRIEDSDDESE